jgi:hypothetical protein
MEQRVAFPPKGDRAAFDLETLKRSLPRTEPFAAAV